MFTLPTKTNRPHAPRHPIPPQSALFSTTPPPPAPALSLRHHMNSPAHPLGTPSFLREVRSRWTVPLMADVSTVEEALAAEEAGADFVGPTLHGYTPYTSGSGNPGLNWQVLQEMCETLEVPVIMEGGIWTPEEARRALDLGAFAVVVGTAITRPRVISAAFVRAMS